MPITLLQKLEYARKHYTDVSNLYMAGKATDEELARARRLYTIASNNYFTGHTGEHGH